MSFRAFVLGRCLTAACCLATAAAADEPIRLGYLTEEPGPAMAALLADILAPIGDIQLRPYADATLFYQDLSSHTLQLGLAEAPEQSVADIFWIAAIYPSVLHVLVASAQPANDLKQILATEGLYTGPPGGVAERLAHALEHQYQINEPAAVDMAAAPAPPSDSPPAYFIFGGLLPDDARRRLHDYRLVSLRASEDPSAQSVAHAIAMRYPQFRPFVLPPDLYPELSRSAVQTVGISTLLLANAHVPPQLVYAIAEKIEQNVGRIADLYPLAQQTGNMTDIHIVPMHPGARSYADRHDPSFLERHADLFALGISALAIIASGLVGWWRHSKQKRKDRLDAYYAKALALRAQLAPNNHAAIGAQLAALQAEVLSLVVDEGIDADGALVAFLLLTNRIMDETGQNHGGSSTAQIQ